MKQDKITTLEKKKRKILSKSNTKSKEELPPEYIKKHKVKVVSGFADIKGMWSLLQNKFHPEKEFLVNMELDNGLHTTFITRITDGKFTWGGKSFLVENEFKYYNLNAQLWASDYHEGSCLPIKRVINITEIKRKMIGKGISDIDRAINPKTLEQFIESQVIEKVMKGEELDSLMRFLKIMSIIICILCVIHLALFLKASGMLDNIRI